MEGNSKDPIVAKVGSSMTATVVVDHVLLFPSFYLPGCFSFLWFRDWWTMMVWGWEPSRWICLQDRWEELWL
jgi:hypothetical protein